MSKGSPFSRLDEDVEEDSVIREINAAYCINHHESTFGWKLFEVHGSRAGSRGREPVYGFNLKQSSSSDRDSQFVLLIAAEDGKVTFSDTECGHIKGAVVGLWQTKLDLSDRLLRITNFPSIYIRRM